MSIRTVPAPEVSYFTPAQVPPSGTAFDPQLDDRPIPLLFKPLKIRGIQFHNRIFVSPMAQYSADEGKMTAWHMAHLGGMLMRGPALTMTESSAVLPEGRATPGSAGLWSDAQIPPLKDIVDFAHSQGVKIGVQLTHSGRKASTVDPWLSRGMACAAEHGGWPDNVWAPSEIPYNEVFPKPKALTAEGIRLVVRAFADASRRAVRAGIDVIEIQNGHGYLLHEFLSPVTNKRTDSYGGSFENRIRLTLEVVDAIRAVIPSDIPLFLRVSATDWLEEVMAEEPSWTIEDTVKLSGVLAEHGVDLLDVSSGGLHPKQKIVHDTSVEFPYQTQFSGAVKKVHGIDTATSLLVGAVGEINTGETAEGVLQSGLGDVVFVARQFQRDTSTVLTFAEQLGIRVKLANQIEWGTKLGKVMAGAQHTPRKDEKK